MKTFAQSFDPGGGPDPSADLPAIRDRLLAREFLYDDPSAYRDGVEAALTAIERSLRGAE